MDFKIDTKDSFSTITPLEKEISAKLTGRLSLKLEEMRQSGSNSFIIDLQQCEEMEDAVIPELLNMHEESYSKGQSLVFTGMSEKIIKLLKKRETDLMLNIAPTMVEAIDIVSMEILERELLSEE